MGGVFGHLAHLYENPNFSFNDLKKILKSAASGELEGTEKTDGYNIYLGYVDGKARAARGKGDVAKGGMDATQVANRKYMGGEKVKDLYVRAFDSYEKALETLSDEEKTKIFGPDGQIYYNAEIQGYTEEEKNGKIVKKPLNIINYDENILNIHRLGGKAYDPTIDKLVSVKDPAHSDFLDKVIDKFENEAADTDFKVRRTAFLKLNKLTDDYDLNIALQKIQKAGLVGSKTIGDLLGEKVKQEMDQELGFLDRKIRKQIMDRIFKESGFQSLTQLTKGLPIEIKAQISEFVTKKSPAIIYEALRPIEMAIYDFSLELLKGLQSAYILNSEDETKRLSNELKQAVEAIRDYRGEHYEEAHKILVKQLEKLKQHENAITTPLEGFVFQVGDQMYKFTGSFAPANQLLGLFKWGRGKIPPIKVDLSAEEEKLDELVIKEHEEKHKLALIPGGFKPPHRGHLEMVKHYLKEVGENGKVLLFIGSGGKNPRCCGDRPITFEDSERIWEIYFANENILYPSPNLEIHQIEGKGPIGTVVDIVKDQVDPETTEVYLGVGEEDTERWDFMIGNDKYNPKNVSIHTKAFPDQADAEGNRLRASNMRKAAERGDKELFQSFLPVNSLKAADDILELLGVEIKDSHDKIEEAAHIPMGIFLGLIDQTLNEYHMFGTGVAYLQDIIPPGKRDEDEESNLDFVKKLHSDLKPKLRGADHDTQHWMGNFITMLGLYNSISKSKKEKYGPEFAKEWIKDGLKHHDRFHSEYLSVHAPEFADEWKLRFEPESSEDELEEISAMGGIGGGSVEGYALPLGAKPRKRKKKKKKNLQEDDELIDEIADYLLSNLGV